MEFTGKNDTIQDVLFELSSEVPVETRSHVPLLGVSYAVFKTAMSTLLDDWLAGEVGTGQPTESWEIGLIRKVNVHVNGGPATEMDAETKQIYDALIERKMPSHFRIVTSHRRWLQRSLAFCQEIGVHFSPEMSTLIRIHDLSKYTHREALGYAVMFGDGRKTFRILENADEKNEWQITLNNHYAANPHHPEYFGKVKQQTNAMTGVCTYNCRSFLEESVIDMLASHGERDLAGDEVFSVRKWMDINPKFLGRYAADDRTVVEDMLEQWKNMAVAYLSNADNAGYMHGQFDDREVCA